MATIYDILFTHEYQAALEEFVISEPAVQLPRPSVTTKVRSTKRRPHHNDLVWDDAVLAERQINWCLRMEAEIVVECVQLTGKKKKREQKTSIDEKMLRLRAKDVRTPEFDEIFDSRWSGSAFAKQHGYAMLPYDVPFTVLNRHVPYSEDWRYLENNPMVSKGGHLRDLRDRKSVV